MKLPIFQTKLHIPIVKDDYIRRAKLTKKLKTLTNYPLTIIHSGAGYGKSTALALYMRDEKISGCWYAISSQDDDLLPFLSYLIHSIRSITPHFGKKLLEYMEEMDRYIREEEIEQLCSLFIQEVLAVKSEIIIILDDFHQIEHSFTVNNWLEILLQHIPSNLHLILSSRSRPSWKQLAKMKASGQLLEITKEDLMLTIEEVELLLSDLYGLTIDQKQLEAIYSMTEGWVIALCMIAQQIPANSHMTSMFEASYQSLQDLFEYLVVEVFAKQPPIIQQFLVQTSIFEEIEENLCSKVIEIQGSAMMLEQLKDRNLFIQKIDGNHYRYHALFRDFLENELKTKYFSSFTALHERSARLYERKEMWEKALYHYKKIDHLEAIASILSKQGKILLESGKLESLLDQLDGIPGKIMDTYYYLWYLKAEVYRYRSKYQQAEESFDRAYRQADQNKDFLGMSKALEGKAKIYLDTIQPQMAENFLYESIAHLEQSPERSNEEIGRMYQLLAENLLNLGKASKAERWLQKAKALNVPNLDRNLEARLYLRTGRFEEAKAVLYQQKQKRGKIKSASFLPQSHRETELLLSLIEAFTGQGLEAKELAQAGIQQGISLKAPFVEACGWIRMGHAVQILSKYDSDLAEQCYNTSLDIMGQLRVDRGKAESYMGLCLLFGVRGDFERAIEVGKRALQETEKVSDLWLSALIKLGMGITCVYNEQLEMALSFLEIAEAAFQDCEDQFGQMLTKFWLSYCYYSVKDQHAFEERMEYFLRLVQMNDYEYFFYKRSVFSPRDLQYFAPLLIEAAKKENQKAYATKILQNMGITAMDSHPGYSLRVQTLGQFKLWLGEKELSEREWKREKAKELFQLLITQFVPIAKDDILQILWPNLDMKNADRDFKVALNTLHHVLEPSRKAREAPFFIIREGSFYRFNPKAVIELDTIQFKDWVQIGLDENDQEKAISCIEKGLSFYHGEYLPERRYDDWCISKRESMLVYFLRGAEKMAQINVRSEKYDQAISWCEKIIERDRTWEEAYRLLMYSYFRKNNRPQAMKWYEKCKQVLEEELGVSPLQPTMHMYKMILNADQKLNMAEQQ